MFQRIRRAAALGAALAMFVSVGATFAHEEREVGDYILEVAFLNEPVYSGEQNGLFLLVLRGDEPVQGLEESVQATVRYGSQTRNLEISPSSAEPGAYESVFFPTAAGPYTFQITGEIEGQAVDEAFTSGPGTFSEVQDVTGGQFPVQFPSTGDIVRDAEAGANAATMATIALVIGGVGLVAGLVALGLTLARKRT